MIALDLSEPAGQRAETYEKIYEEKLSDIDISVLINNAGYAHVGEFATISDSDVHKQLTCNTYPIVLLTQQVIKSFKQRYERFGMRSLLISTASIAAQIPIPFASTYSASKRFVDFTMWSLREELSCYGVDVCSWQTATVSTKMTSFSRARMAYTPDEYVKQALSRCTSGANAGAFKHDFGVMTIQFFKDIIPLALIIRVVAKFSKKTADKVAAREKANADASQAPGYNRLD